MENLNFENKYKINQLNKKNLLICCSGSVASILVKEIIEYGLKQGYNIKLILTKSAKIFADEKLKDYDKFCKETGCPIYTDENEWDEWSEKREVLHIELRKWADILLLAPLSSNTLGKICSGISDNLLTCVVKAWEWGKKPVFYALAMNTAMFINPLTDKHRQELSNNYLTWEIPVVKKKLKCGDEGEGALNQIDVIFKKINCYVNRKTIYDYFVSK